MSLRIGIILPKNTKEEVLDKIRQKYNLALLRFDNNYIQSKLQSDEQFFQVSEHGVDNYTGIGAYKLYTKDLAPIYKSNDLSEERKMFLLDSIKKIREGYEKDAKKWIMIIKEIVLIHKIKKIGVFYFNGYTTSNEVNPQKLQRAICKIRDLNVTYMMQIKENIIVFFIHK